MTTFDQIKYSIRYSFESFSILRKAGLNWIYLIPVAFYLLFFILGFSLTNGLHGHVMAWLQELIVDFAETVPYLDAMMTFASVIFWLIIKVLLFIVIGAVSGYLILIILAPLLTWVSEKVFVSQGGSAPPFNTRRFVNDLIRALRIAIRNGLIQVGLLIVFFIVGFIPVINIIAAPALFLVSAYYYGFSFLDYSFERDGFSVAQSVRAARELKWAAVVLGSIFLFISTLPWIGPLLASMFVFHLVTAATMVVSPKA